MKNDQLVVQTKLGNLIAEPIYDDEYPGIAIYLNGDLLTWTEYTPLEGNIQTCLYVPNRDEPEDVFVHSSPDDIIANEAV